MNKIVIHHLIGDIFNVSCAATLYFLFAIVGNFTTLKCKRKKIVKLFLASIADFIFSLVIDNVSLVIIFLYDPKFFSVFWYHVVVSVVGRRMVSG